MKEEKEDKKEKKQVLLVDGSGLLHRAYHAYPKLKTKSGELVNAVYGVGSMLISSLQERDPEYVVVAWDTGKPTFRHEEYVAYKAHRPETDEELKDQFPLVEKMLSSFSIRQVKKDGFEADDILGTLAERLKESEDMEILILTGDKDLVQLVDDEKVMVLIPGRGGRESRLYDEKEVEEKFGVKASQIVDYKAMVGDSSDNIPGVKGVGPKTAERLLNEFESLKEVYESLEEVEEKFGERVRGLLERGRESAMLSKSLADIRRNVEFEFDLDEAVFEDLKSESVRRFLDEMNFKSLKERLFEEKEKEKKQDKQMGLF